MYHFILGLSILVNHFYLEPIFRFIFIKPGISGGKAMRLDMFGDVILLFPAILLAWIICKKLSLIPNFSTKNIAFICLAAGVYLFIFYKVIFLIMGTVPHAVYLIGKIPFIKYMYANNLFYSFIYGILFYGVSAGFLSVKFETSVTS